MLPDYYATSCRKSSCDWVRGVKRKLTLASLMRLVNSQLLTEEAVHAFCETEIKGLDVFLIPKKDLEKKQKI